MCDLRTHVGSPLLRRAEGVLPCGIHHMPLSGMPMPHRACHQADPDGPRPARSGRGSRGQHVPSAGDTAMMLPGISYVAACLRNDVRDGRLTENQAREIWRLVLEKAHERELGTTSR